MTFLPTKKRGLSTIVSMLVLFGLLLLSVWLMSNLLKTQEVTYKYSDIVYMFVNGQVKEYSLDLGSGKLQIKVNMDAEGAEDIEASSVDKKDGTKYVAYQVPNVTIFLNDIDDAITRYNLQDPETATITPSNGPSSGISAGGEQKPTEDRIGITYIPAKDNSWILTVVMTLVPVILLVVFFFFIMRQSGGAGKMNQFTKAGTKGVETGKKATFAEVAGADEEKEELEELVQFLKHPDRFNTLGARIPKGVLLVGPPGTGKTLLARAVAGEAGVPFYSISGSDFVEMYVGVGASRVRDLFATAKKNAPAIVFIDEIDAVGRHRGAGLGGGHDEREQTLNQLLVEMDGFGENTGVIIMAATNRRDILDPALLRPGRFDRQIVVGYPDVKGREEILRVHARNKPLGFDVDLNKIARTTAGFTGADLENLLNEAALLAARNNRKAIIEKDIEAATIKVVAGPEKKSHKMSDQDKKITAYHEAGHAITSYYCPTQDKVHEISIIPRGMAAGYTMNLPDEDRMHLSKTKMRENLIVLLAGRVAEEIALDDVCTGASNDIERATNIARDMVTRYGFSTTLGPIVYGQADNEVFLGRELNHQRNYSENVAKEIDAEIRELIDKSYEEARAILKEHFDQLELVSKWLIEYEKIDSDTFEKLMKGELEFTPRPKEEKKEDKVKEIEQAEAETNETTVEAEDLKSKDETSSNSKETDKKE